MLCVSLWTSAELYSCARVFDRKLDSLHRQWMSNDIIPPAEILIAGSRRL